MTEDNFRKSYFTGESGQALNNSSSIIFLNNLQVDNPGRHAHSGHDPDLSLQHLPVPCMSLKPGHCNHERAKEVHLAGPEAWSYL